jgi:hypothetical protein
MHATACILSVALPIRTAAKLRFLGDVVGASARPPSPVLVPQLSPAFSAVPAASSSISGNAAPPAFSAVPATSGSGLQLLR